MGLTAALVAFVAGAWFLQQQAVLPSFAEIAGCAALALAVLSVALRALRRARHNGSSLYWVAFLRCGVLIAAWALGAVHAAALAKWQVADELAFADEGRDVLISGVVASLPAQLLRGTRFEFDVVATEPVDVHVPARISLGWYAPAAKVRPGESWQFGARLRRPHGTLNQGGFDLEAWMLERNLRASGYVRDVAATPPERLASMTWRAGYAIDRLRDALRERLQARLAEARYGGVLIALVLGDQRAIGEDDWLLFNRTGISHLVSISGLHITMIAGLVAVMVSGLWRRSAQALALAPTQFAAAVAALAGALCYCLLAGWGVPAQRTFFMLATVATALLLHLRTRAVTTLALAAGGVTALDPWAVLAPGFWLSFGAVAAIFYAVHGRGTPRTGWRGWCVEAARTQWVVTIALVPLTVVLFQQVSLVSPFANAIAIPLVSLIVTPLALVAACFVALPDPLATIATPLLAIAHALLVWLAGVLGWMSQWPAAALAVASPATWAAALAVLGTAWLLAPPAWPLRWAGLAWLVPLFVWPAEHPQAGELWITALDVGQGSALVVEAAGGVLVYDSGPRYSPQADAGSRIVVPYLRSRGIGRIDLLVLSHLDSDHSGGAASILKVVEVATVWTSIDAGAAMLASARTVRRCLGGDEARLGAAQVRMLHPTEVEYALPARNTNARSCVVEVVLGRWRVLLTGDLPGAQERALLERYGRARADLVAAPHHGSRNSSTEPFVSAVAPTWVVAQAGYRNRFAHPDAAVVARYLCKGASFVRTDFAGATQWRFNADGRHAMFAQRLDAARYWHNRPEAPAVAACADPTAPALDDEPPGFDPGTVEVLVPRE